LAFLCNAKNGLTPIKKEPRTVAGMIPKPWFLLRFQSAFRRIFVRAENLPKYKITVGFLLAFGYNSSRIK